MKRYLRNIAFFILPIFLLILPFFVKDPFKCLHTYDSYWTYGEPMLINIGRTHVSAQTYERYRDTYHWNSFIFGSSRSGFYRVKDWKKHLPDDAVCFHFDGYGESLYNIYHKIKYVDGKSPLDNVLLCIDDEVLFVDHNENTQLHCIDPILTDEVSWWDYCAVCLRAYLKPKFLKSYIPYILTGHIYNYMKEDGVFDTSPYYCDLATNETGRDDLGNMPDSILYSPDNLARYPERSDKQEYMRISAIKERQEDMLIEIRDILEKNHSSYKVVLNPCYKQVKLMPQDSVKLRKIFGDHLYDCSGINKWTEDIHNYNDPAHFKSSVAAEVMDAIYAD